jgi:hypothetical protein
VEYDDVCGISGENAQKCALFNGLWDALEGP